MAKKSTPGSKSSSGTGGVDLHEVERLLEFMAKHGLEEFEYERSGFRIRLRKPFSQPMGFSRAVAAPDIVVAASAAPAPSHHAASASTPAPREGSGESGRPGAEDVHVVKSPIVGTFYAAPTVGGEPFVTVGSRVEAGQALCIIEAMKLMNEIESDVAGEVVKIFVENGQPVEYGESLFGIHPHRKK
ncbi:MAG TPA: acetyl-CoA carboxylase biotin carboxyl carrier protein [Candidatus Acidoferrales bacterium]|jgi:acetyl-CoA carboxylase biotin carboxyl carrier protein|nr:acetyl-CoA carboxylase biotin carboxyl carrier protein [Candidatus Acidoferrales bacterium]